MPPPPLYPALTTSEAREVVQAWRRSPSPPTTGRPELPSSSFVSSAWGIHLLPPAAGPQPPFSYLSERSSPLAYAPSSSNLYHTSSLPLPSPPTPLGCQNPLPPSPGQLCVFTRPSRGSRPHPQGADHPHPTTSLSSAPPLLTPQSPVPPRPPAPPRP